MVGVDQRPELDATVTPPMLHVWTVDRPGGPFSGL